MDLEKKTIFGKNRDPCTVFALQSFWRFSFLVFTNSQLDMSLFIWNNNLCCVWSNLIMQCTSTAMVHLKTLPHHDFEKRNWRYRYCLTRKRSEKDVCRFSNEKYWTFFNVFCLAAENMLNIWMCTTGNNGKHFEMFQCSLLCQGKYSLITDKQWQLLTDDYHWFYKQAIIAFPVVASAYSLEKWFCRPLQIFLEKEYQGAE